MKLAYDWTVEITYLALVKLYQDANDSGIDEVRFFLEIQIVMDICVKLAHVDVNEECLLWQGHEVDIEFSRIPWRDNLSFHLDRIARRQTKQSSERLGSIFGFAFSPCESGSGAITLFS